MTEKEKDGMEKDMHNLLKEKMNLTELGCEFLQESINALHALTEAVKDDPYYQPFSDEEDEDYYDEEAIVLYVEPGKVATLIEEYEAIDEMIIAKKVDSFGMHFITEDLMVVYPENCAKECSDGSVFVAGPMYIAHPIISEYENAIMDLTAMDFCEALAYLATHTIRQNNIAGFMLEKED